MSEENSDFTWKGFIDSGFVDRITVSGVNKRCSAIENELLPLIAAHPMEDRELVHIILALKATVNLYVDRESRSAVLKVLRELAAKKAEVFVKAIAGVLDPVVESAQPKSIAHPDAIPTAVATRFVLLSWVNLALTVPIKQLGAEPEALAASDAAWKRLVVLAARLLWGIAPAHPHMRYMKQNSISNSAHRDVWRMLRECPSVIGPMLSILTTETTNNEFAAVLIGNIVSCAVRLAPGKGREEAVATVEKFKEAIVGFVDRVLIGSKTIVSYSSVVDLGEFLRTFVGGEFVGLFKASIAKMLLRSPETVLPTCLWLLESLDAQTVDLSAIYLDVFADTLASNLIKSSNASVRKNAANLFGFLANTPTSAEAASKAAEIATKPLTLGRYAQPEQRTEMYKLLGGVHAGPGGGWASAAVIVPALVKMTGKETIEQPVCALFTALGVHFGHLVEHLAGGSEEGKAECIEAVKLFSEAAKKGLALPDRSSTLRHAWAADAVGEALWKAGEALDGQAWAAEHIAPLVAALTATAEKVAANPLAASGGSGTLDAHVGLALTLHAQSSSSADSDRLFSLVTDAEKSLVLWDKVFHKSTGVREALWLLRCAQVLYQRGSNDKRLGELLMWVVCRMPEASRRVAHGALDTLTAMAAADAARLWKLLERSVVAELAAGRQPVGGSSWRDVLAAIAGGHCEQHAKQTLLVSMALAAHYPAATGEAGSLGRQSGLWISLAQRVGVDPADMCYERLDELLQVARQAMADDTKTADVTAASALVRDLVFIGGESVAQRVLEIAHDEVDPAALKAVTDEDIAVWQTPADQLHTDPLATKGAAATASKNVRGKTSDDVWAEELRQELARKKNEARKLTREEQELVDRQRAAEAATRMRVEQARAALSRALALARAVLEGSAAVGGACMLQLVRLVVERAMLGGGAAAARLAGREVLTTVAGMAECAEGLEPGLRQPLAMGLLRVRGFADVVPLAWQQESVEDLASRVYFRLRVACDTAPLPAAGFNFVLPFMQATAEAGGWGRRVRRGVEEHDEYAQMDHAAEQLTMVVDVLGFHAHFGGDSAMPRKEMVDLLVLLMATQPTLLTACRRSLVRLAEEMEGADTALERDALLAGLLQPDSAVRSACLAALDFADLTELDYSTALWINVGGSGAPALDDNAAAARLLWTENGLEVLPALVNDLVPHLASDAAEIRDAAARAIALAVQQLQADDLPAAEMQAVVDDTLEQLLSAYRRWHISLEPEYDAYGIVVPGTQNRQDTADARVAVAAALAHLAPYLASAAQMQRLVAFLVRERVLGERSEAVRTRMLDAGAQAVASHGNAQAAALLPELEGFLSAPDEGSFAHDCIREGVVVLLGRLAQHLPASDGKRVAAAVDRLVDALNTPAESVQRAVSECLPPLARLIDDEKQHAVVELLVQRTLEGQSYAARRGGAYGLAGVVKGLGLAALKRHGVVDRLRAACEGSSPHARQGALFAVETLAAALGRLFEPYVIQFVPLLLALFGDPNADVRAAALDTARVVMAHISGHGVKLVLPAALTGLDDDRWRTKKGSVEMLGAMAFCAPKQLSLALPAIVPRIVTVLADSHGQVAAAARGALLRFGDVIHNPEIQVLVPTLLAALDDPAGRTDAALVRLLHTPFVHYIDAASLALVVPVLQRGMRSRAASTKRTAAQIMGAMATLTEPADLAPYLGELVPLVRGVLVDPVPEARATAAKALGALVQRLGEARFPSLVADLVRVLKSDASGVDRAGAAQGLSEVLAGIGLTRLEGLLAEVVANCRSAQPAVREGFVLLLIYLPTTFGDAFQPFLPRVVPPVLQALADDVEVVRSAALRAGRILVASFAGGEGVDLLLPALLGAMHDAAWRIRHSAVDLLGELLLRVAGVSGKQAERDREAARALFFAKQTPDEGEEAEVAAGETEPAEEDEEALEDAAIAGNLREILSDKLGSDRYCGVLAALYVARSDVAAMVRQAAFGVWKSLVSNTPRTVRECLPYIVDAVLGGLAAQTHDRRTSAARALGDLVHKLGDAVMARVVPILERALDQPVSSTSLAADDEEDDGEGEDSGSIRHGVFIGLAEILASAGKAHADAYADATVPLVRRGLCDADPLVREAAASAFNALQQAAGPRVIDAIVPPLLAALQDASSPYALDALRELMAVRATAVFPVLIPTLTRVPVSAFNARALSALVQVAGSGLSKRLPLILRALIDSLPTHTAAAAANEEGEEDVQALRDAVDAVAQAAVHDEQALDLLVAELHEAVRVPERCDLVAQTHVAARVAEACNAFGALCSASGAASAGRGRSALGVHVVDWLRVLIELLAAPAPNVVESAWAALDALCRAVPKEDYDGYVGPVSRAVQQATQPLPSGRTLPGFDLPRGLAPLLPIYAQGLLAGSPDTKERAVRGMARLVRYTSAAALRPFATSITGPLIRIVGDRNAPNVKAAILATLGLLLTHIPQLMRPFLPQLQRTFVRGLSEPDDSVRQRAASALAALIPLQPRLDPLVAELTAALRAAEEVGMKLAMLRALRAVAGAPTASSLSPASLQALEDAVVSRADPAATSDSRWRALAAQTFGALCAVLPKDAASQLVMQHALGSTESAESQAARLELLAGALAQASVLFDEQMLARVVAAVESALQPDVRGEQGRLSLQAVLVARTALLLRDVVPDTAGALAAPLLALLIRTVDPATMASYDTDTQHAALSALKSLAKHRFALVQPVQDQVVLAALAHVRDRVVTVKLAAERCLLYSLRLARVPHEQFDGDTVGLDGFVERVGGAASEKGKLALDYHRRVLCKLADSTRELDYASDDEVDSPLDGALAADDEPDYAF